MFDRGLAKSCVLVGVQGIGVFPAGQARRSRINTACPMQLGGSHGGCRRRYFQ